MIDIIKLSVGIPRRARIDRFQQFSYFRNNISCVNEFSSTSYDNLRHVQFRCFDRERGFRKIEYSKLSIYHDDVLDNFKRMIPKTIRYTRWMSTLSESQFHTIADETLDTIQDTIDDYFDTKDDIEYEVSLSSGVLNLSFPPHGTWVINKQTPNRQIWWSSPLSGPRRFEYDFNNNVWICTKDRSELGLSLMKEVHTIYPNAKDFSIDL